MFDPRLTAAQAAAEGLKRAQARQAPEQFQDQPQWTMPYNEATGESLGGIYKQREQDRSAAYRGQHPMDDSVIRGNPMGGNMAGYMEALYHNDNQAQAGGIPKFLGNKAGILGAPQQMDNPAGMTEGASQDAARQYAAGGALPDWYAGALPATQRRFGRNTQHALAGLHNGIK